MISQLSLQFAEDEIEQGTWDDILKCDGATLVLDVETTGLSPYKDKLLGIGVYCPDRQINKFVPPYREAKEAVTKIAQNPETLLIGQNIKFDASFLGLNLYDVPCKIADTVVMSHLFDSRQTKNLADLEYRWLGTETKKQTRGKEANVWDMPLGTMSKYCLNDCRITYEISKPLSEKLKELKLGSLFKREMAYLRLLQRIEQRGLMVDFDWVRKAVDVLKAEIKEQEKELYEKTKPPKLFNWRSDSQLSYILYDHLGIAKPKLPEETNSRQMSKYNSTCTSKEVLVDKLHHPLGELVTLLREADKLLETLEDWKERVLEDGILHTNFNQTGTVTGRLSSSKPNLQNLTAKYRRFSEGDNAERDTEHNLRYGLVARPEHTFLGCDYSQQELRLLAILSQEPALLDAMRRKVDLHTETAKMIWGKTDDNTRYWAKTMNFAIIYGLSVKGIKEKLNKTEKEARELLDQYFRRFPKIRPWLKETELQCSEYGYVRYWDNRIWREPDPVKAYKAANAKIQGGCADIISVAALRVQRYLDEQDAGQIVSIIHDELLFEIPTEKVEKVKPDLLKIMELDDLFDPSFLAEGKMGTSYGGLKKDA